jgi:hypothetical protein
MLIVKANKETEKKNLAARSSWKISSYKAVFVLATLATTIAIIGYQHRVFLGKKTAPAFNFAQKKYEAILNSNFAKLCFKKLQPITSFAKTQFSYIADSRGIKLCSDKLHSITSFAKTQFSYIADSKSINFCSDKLHSITSFAKTAISHIADSKSINFCSDKLRSITSFAKTIFSNIRSKGHAPEAQSPITPPQQQDTPVTKQASEAQDKKSSQPIVKKENLPSQDLAIQRNNTTYMPAWPISETTSPYKKLSVAVAGKFSNISLASLANLAFSFAIKKIASSRILQIGAGYTLSTIAAQVAPIMTSREREKTIARKIAKITASPFRHIPPFLIKHSLITAPYYLIWVPGRWAFRKMSTKAATPVAPKN